MRKQTRPVRRTRGACILAALFGAAAFVAGTVSTADPLRVHPDNPRYFTDGSGKAVYLTGSHTWASRQERGVEGETPDFDYDEYLDFLDRNGHNFIRLWAWEHAQWMQFVSRRTPIRYDPLPYPRTGPGAALDGKPKFDVTQFDEAYFDRLHARVFAARQRGIYVAVMLFQGFSVEQKGTKGVDPEKGNAWEGHPFHAANNINAVNGDADGDGEGTEVHTLKIPTITALQEAYVQKVIDTLGDLDNVLWEISNESHRDSVPWQYHMIRFIKEYEASKPQQHPVGMTGAPIQNPALFDSPADWISPVGKQFLNDPPPADGSKVIIVDTDHIAPWGHDPSWPWKNFLRGNHFILMDSYVDFRIDSPAKPNPESDPIRQAMGHARKLAWAVNLAAMVPRPELASTGYCLAEPGAEYVVYQPDPGAKAFTVELKPGKYSAEWIDALEGTATAAEAVDSKGGPQSFTPPVDGPAVLHLKRSKG